MSLRDGGPSGAIAGPGAEAPSDLNVRILRSLATCLKQEHGPAAFDRAASAAGLNALDFDGRTRWISLEQCEAFLAEAREAFPSDEAFRDGCAHEFRQQSYGPWLVALRAVTPWAGYVLACRHMTSLITRIGHFKPERSGGRCTIRYRSSRQESRLMCLPRLGQMMAMPTLWGLPPVEVAHPRCIARGDDCCEYGFHLAEPVRWLPGLVGVILGLLALPALRFGLHVATPWEWLLPALGLLAGAGFEWRRSSRANLALALDMQAAMAEVTSADAEARLEILAFQQRQRDWSRLLEEQIAERVAAQQKVVEEIRTLETRRVAKLRAFSHDLRNPLSVVSISTDCLRREGVGPLDQELADDLAHASRQMAGLIDNLMHTLGTEESLLKLTPRDVAVAPLVEKLRRRLNALCYHRDIRTSTFSTREAPDSILIDELLLDRVVDNLLANAAKYTERGSILVEVGGTPGFLTLKFSDTGRGIEQDSIEHIFLPGGSDPGTRARDSYGLGLSVVVQLLGSVGGRLEVMSKPGVGTTFWVHLPVRPASPTTEVAAEDVVRKVVVIRKMVG